MAINKVNIASFILLELKQMGFQESVVELSNREIQPLDVFFFRPYRNCFRMVSDFALYYNFRNTLHDRCTVMKLHGCIYNQFKSPR